MKIQVIMSDEKQNHSISFLSVIQSSFAAAFGVQSKKNRERDFSEGKPIVFITAGIVFALVFILSVYSVVQIVVP